MVLNAGRNVDRLTSADKLVTIASLLEKYTDESYAAAMSGKADIAKLDRSIIANSNLAKVLDEAIHKLNIETPENPGQSRHHRQNSS